MDVLSTKKNIFMRLAFVSDVYMVEAVHETAYAPTLKRDPACMGMRGRRDSLHELSFLIIFHSLVLT